MRPRLCIIPSHKKRCFVTSVGYSGPNPHTVNITPKCSRIGWIVHLIGYILGLWPEAVRPDRSSYIKVHYANIIPKYKFLFKKRSRFESTSYNLTYDYNSLMHWGAYAFSKNRKPTITVNNPRAYRRQRYPVLGQRCHLSRKDMLAMNIFYRCCVPPISRDKVIRDDDEL